MTIERSVMAFAGMMILISLILTTWVSPHFIWFTAFIGANLFQSAFTGFCPIALLLKRLGMKTEAQCALAKIL